VAVRIIAQNVFDDRRFHHPVQPSLHISNSAEGFSGSSSLCRRLGFLPGHDFLGFIVQLITMPGYSADAGELPSQLNKKDR
jgi:hypothetical protein